MFERRNMRSMVLISCLLAASTGMARVVDVSISGFAFNPASVTATVGDTVRWTNQDAVPHTSTSGKPDSSPGLLWDSPHLSQNASYSLPITFVAGNVPYYCRVHTSMRATLTSLAGVEEDQHAGSAGVALMVPQLNARVISFSLGRTERVTVRVRDIRGRTVLTLARDQPASPGKTNLAISAGLLQSGVYIVVLETNSGNRNARTIVVR
jgi:plastocyanin